MVVVVLGFVLSLIGVLLVWYLLSDNAEVAENGVISRAMRHVPIQSLKIIIVVWQIVTQASDPENWVLFPTFLCWRNPWNDPSILSIPRKMSSD